MAGVNRGHGLSLQPILIITAGNAVEAFTQPNQEALRRELAQFR